MLFIQNNASQSYFDGIEGSLYHFPIIFYCTNMGYRVYRAVHLKIGKKGKKGEIESKMTPS